MRQFLTFAFASVPFGVLAAAFACGSSTSSTPPATDAGPVADTSEIDDFNLDVGTALDSSGSLCALSDGSDPVLLCSQYQALSYLTQFAYQSGTGVAPGFTSQMPYGAASGHNWRDDLGFAAAIGQYQCSAGYYHNTSLFTATLEDLAPIVAGELNVNALGSTQVYDGEIYFQLRDAAAGYFVVMDTTNGAAMNAAADAYAMGIAHNFVFTVPLVEPPPDGGVDAGGKRQKDAGDEAGDAGPPTAMIIGTHNADGSVNYSPPQSVMAAAALLDMASRYGGTDAGADAPTWEAIGTAVLAYVWDRARDPKTGLFYQALVTSGDEAHDALASSGWIYTNDALLTDVQGQVALGLARAQAAVAPSALLDAGLSADGSLPPVPPYALEAESLATALTCLGAPLSTSCAGLFDGTPVDPTSPPSTVPPAAFMEGIIASTGTILHNKTTLGNALMFGATARASALGAGTPCIMAGPDGSMQPTAQCLSWENAQIRWELSFTDSTGQPWSPNVNLTSVVVQNGDVSQLAYLRASSQSYFYADAFSPTGADAGLESDATTYLTSATVAMIEGMTQLWYGRQNGPLCGF